MATEQLVVGTGNEGQVRAWDGDEGTIWAKHATHFDRAVRNHHAVLMRGAQITPDDVVLDIGCGTGQTTRDAARSASEGRAVGVDLSEVMLAVARTRAAEEGIGNADFLQADAQVYPFEQNIFDVAISRTGTMFFADQQAAFTNIASALKPGARLAMVSWQGPEGNEWLTSFQHVLTGGRGMAPPPPGAPSPFAHADPDRTTQVLSASGFTDIDFEGHEAPMYFGETPEEGYAVLRPMFTWMTGELSDDEREAAFADFRRALEDHATADGVAYRSASWLITARRR